MTDDRDLDTRINDKGFIEHLVNERERFYLERIARLSDRMDEMEKALVLQAAEYARRLHDLNGEYQRDRARQSQYVTTDKWETTNESERVAREAALLRVDEKFEEYVKRYEVRQREIDQLLAAQKGAAEEAKKAADATGRRSNRNLGIASIVLGGIVLLANVAPYFVQ